MFVRLRRAEGVERQQVKWFAYAAAVLAVCAFVSWVLSDAVGMIWPRRDVAFAAIMVGLAGLPVALGIANLRYRPHDVDLMINRTLVYGILTAALSGVFEVTVVALQEVFLVLTHMEESHEAYFASAMVIAALFDPLKSRIDTFVEGRFFRRMAETVGERPTQGNPSLLRRFVTLTGARGHPYFARRFPVVLPLEAQRWDAIAKDGVESQLG